MSPFITNTSPTRRMRSDPDDYFKNHWDKELDDSIRRHLEKGTYQSIKFWSMCQVSYISISHVVTGLKYD